MTRQDNLFSQVTRPEAPQRLWVRIEEKLHQPSLLHRLLDAFLFRGAGVRDMVWVPVSGVIMGLLVVSTMSFQAPSESVYDFYYLDSWEQSQGLYMMEVVDYL